MSTMTLEQKVNAILDHDDTGKGAYARVHEKALFTGGNYNEHELDLVDWGMVYGIALGLRRVEEPLEPIEAAAWHAQRAAWRVFAVRNHGFTRQPEVPTDEEQRAVCGEPLDEVTA